MIAEIITIGDEILIGQIIDTNSKWIAEHLNQIGISVYQITSIQDEKEHILQALNDAKSRVDIILITGGLGPTKDDITKHTLAEYFDSEMSINDAVVTHIKEMFKKVNYPFTELNRLQALLPDKCTPLFNKLGTAPGMWFDDQDKVIVSMPGVPFEMKGLMNDEVLPRLKSKYDLPFIIHQTIITHGMGESALAETIESWEDHLPEFIKLAYLPSPGRVRLRLSAKGPNRGTLEEALALQVGKLESLISEIIVGYEQSESLEVIIQRLLAQRGKTLSVAESCTGGAISTKITAIPGASKYYKGAVIAYNRTIKESDLNVASELIATHSVVSKEVAKAMALGVQKKFDSDYAIATTGNAGPTIDETDKTVGDVCIAIATPDEVLSFEYNFGKPREKVIERATNMALDLLRKEILKK